MLGYRLALAARSDIVDILAYTEQNFGELARRRYERLLTTAIRDVAAEPERIGTVARPELGEHVRTFHLRHSRDRAKDQTGIIVRPRRLLLYRLVDADWIDIGRVLHDSMELERHLPADFN